MTDSSSKKETVEKKKAREERERQELQEKRNQQLLDAQGVLEKFREKLRDTKGTIRACRDLSSHTDGFYEEINKLTKGKLLIGVTDLAVAQANEIIRDAKKIVKNDVHLDRIKEFVPAGDNPVYPDVLLTVRSVRDSLERADKNLDDRLKFLRGRIQRIHTLIGALQYVLDEETEEEEKRYPRKAAVESYVEGDVSDFCFSAFRGTYEEYFDFDQLDGGSVEEYVSMGTEEDEDDDPDTEDTDDIEGPDLDDDEHDNDEEDSAE
jgi:hypothetical protein